MPSFKGSLHLADDPDSAVRSQLNVEDSKLRLSAAGEALGDWDLSDLVMKRNGDSLYIEVNDETVVFVTSEPDRLSRVIGLPDEPPETPETKKPKPKRRQHREPRQYTYLDDARTIFRNIPKKIKVATAVGIAALVFAIVAPRLFATILAVAGAAGVLAAIVALLDPLIAARVPGRYPPGLILGVSLVVMTTGIIIGALT